MKARQQAMADAAAAVYAHMATCPVCSSAALCPAVKNLGHLYVQAKTQEAA